MSPLRRKAGREWIGMRLSTRLLLLILICMAPLVAAQVYTGIELHRQRQAQIRELVLRQAELANSDLASIVDGARQLAITIAQLPDVQALGPACNERLAGLQRRFPAYRFVAIVDAQGSALCASAASLLGSTLPQRDWFSEVARGGDPGVGARTSLSGVDGAFLPVGVSMPDQRGNPASPGLVVMLALDPVWLGGHLRELEFGRTALLAPSRLLITDRSGALVASLPVPDDAFERSVLPTVAPLVALASPGVTTAPDGDNRPHLTAYVPVSANPLGLATIVSVYLPDLTGDVDAATWRQALLVISAALIAPALTFWVGKRFIFRPTERLLAAARRWRDGDLSARAEVTDPRSEFGALATSFNAMATSLQARELERRLEAELLEAQVAERTQELSETNNRLQVEIAEREKTEAALHQAQKLQAVGQLAGGIAHDFNNMLATILGSLELMERRLPTAGQPWPDGNVARLRDLIRRASDAVQRGAQLTSRLLAFSRRQRLSERPTDLNLLVTDLVTLATSTLGRRVRVVTDLAADLWPAMADPSQVEAAILNLCLNARDAMPDGGQLTITTANHVLDQRLTPDEPEPGAYVRVSIIDTGVGMTEDVLRRAFDPFFTTKGPSGSGLGLSQVYGMARQLGGTVRIRSTPGEGTEVDLLLPRANQAVEPDAGGRTGDRARRASPPPSLVLLVDDDAAVRHVTVEMLRDLGCEVLDAPGAQEALALLGGPARQASVILLDYAMPGMNGLQLARAIRERGLSAPIVLATGYAELTDPAEADPALLDGLLRKPFSIRELQATLVRLRRRQGRESNVVPLRSPKRG